MCRGGDNHGHVPSECGPCVFLSDPCAPTRIPRTEQNDPHFNYILYSGPASPIWRLFSKLSRRGCRGHGACGGEKGARSPWMPSVCVFCLDPVAPPASQELGPLTPFFNFAPLSQPLPCQLSPLSQKIPARAPRRHVSVKEKRGHVPYDCGPGCWLVNPDLPLSLFSPSHLSLPWA